MQQVEAVGNLPDKDHRPRREHRRQQRMPAEHQVRQHHRRQAGHEHVADPAHPRAIPGHDLRDGEQGREGERGEEPTQHLALEGLRPCGPFRHDIPAACRDAGPPLRHGLHHIRQRGAGHERVHARIEAEVDALVGPDADVPRAINGDARRPGQQQPGLGRERAPDPLHGEDDQRPNEVELLLDGQRPAVVQPRHVIAEERLRPVRRVAQRQGEIGAGKGLAERRLRHRHHGAGQEQRRRQPQEAPRVEVPEIDRARPLPLGAQDGRDEEAAQDEKNVHPHPAAAEPGHAAMRAEHDADRDRAQTIQGGVIGVFRQAGSWVRGYG